jgi:hypothetical protein
MKVILSAHAVEAMALRNIELAWIEAAIRPLRRSAGACCALSIGRRRTVLWGPSQPIETPSRPGPGAKVGVQP